jgi:hypothetical protein
MNATARLRTWLRGEPERARAWGAQLALALERPRVSWTGGALPDDLAASGGDPDRTQATGHLVLFHQVDTLVCSAGLVPCVTKGLTLDYAASVAGGQGDRPHSRRSQTTALVRGPLCGPLSATARR